MSDFLSGWLKRWTEHSDERERPDFLSAWREHFGHEGDEWETRGPIQINRKTGEKRLVPMPGALEPSRSGVEDVQKGDVPLKRYAEDLIMDRGFGWAIGLGEKLGQVPVGTREKLRSMAERTQDRYLQANPEGGLGRAAILAAGEIGAGMAGPSSIAGPGAGALGARALGALGVGRIGQAAGSALAGAGENALEMGADTIDLEGPERWASLGMGTALGLAGGAGEIHGGMRRAAKEAAEAAAAKQAAEEAAKREAALRARWAGLKDAALEERRVQLEDAKRKLRGGIVLENELETQEARDLARAKRVTLASVAEENIEDVERFAARKRALRGAVDDNLEDLGLKPQRETDAPDLSDAAASARRGALDERRQLIREAWKKPQGELTMEEAIARGLYDSNTGLLRREAWEAESHSYPFVAMIDADGLKYLNDTHSHGVGDELLRTIADASEEEGIKMYRYGGDEFVFGARSERAAREKVKRLRDRVASAKIQILAADGSVADEIPVRFGHGIGKTTEQADAALNARKARQRAKGGPVRGDRPLGGDLFGGEADAGVGAGPPPQYFAPDPEGRFPDPVTGEPQPGGFVYVNGGTTGIPYIWRLREADDLIASHNIDFSENPRFAEAMGEQPRDRDRAALREQVFKIKNDMNPAMLWDNVLPQHGAPIVGPDMAAESGNGRLIAIQQGYAENHPRIVGYRAFVTERAARLGLGDASAMRRPVLVRERLGDHPRNIFVEQANKAGVARYGAPEQALSDAKRLRPETLDLFVANELGELDTAANRDFVRAFAADVVDIGEANAFFDATGALSTEGRVRMRNALLAAAYPDVDAVARIAEDLASEMGAVGRSMTAVAPRVTRLRSAITRGERFDLDLSKDLSQAAVRIDELRRQGTTVDAWLQNRELEVGSGGKEALSPEGRYILERLNEVKRSGKEQVAFLNRYHELADPDPRVDPELAHARDPRQTGLFGAADPPTKMELLEQAWATRNKSRTIDPGSGPSPAGPGGGALGLTVGPSLAGLPSLGAVSQFAKGAAKLIRRWLTSSGDFAALGEHADHVAERARLGMAAQRAHQARAVAAMADLDDALGRQMEALAARGINRTVDDVLSHIVDGIEGKASLSTLTPEIQEIAVRMRAHLDELTGGLLNNQKMTKDLREILHDNLGKYLRRTYEIHRNPVEWERFVKEEEPWRWTNAKDFVRDQHPAWSDAEIEGYLNAFFQKQGEVAGAFAPRSDAFRIDKGIFKHRLKQHIVTLDTGEVRTYSSADEARIAANKAKKAGHQVTISEEEGLPKALEDFLGLHHDPRPRYAEAVAKMAHDLEVSKLLAETEGLLRNSGQLFDQPTGQAAKRIAGDPAFNPLAGKYASPEVAAVLEGMTQTQARGPAWLEAVYKANAAVRAGKTALSPLTHVRNTLSWIPMQLANGNFIQAFNVVAAARSAMTVLGGPRLTPQGRIMRGLNALADSMGVQRLDLDALRREYQEGVRLGVLQEGAWSSEMARYLGILVDPTTGKHGRKNLGERIVDSALEPGGALRTLYAAEDDIGKLMAWRAERAKYAKAYPNKSEQEIAELTAGLVRDLYPTYSKAAPGIRAVRDFPFVGDFPTFWAEIARTSKNILKQGVAELRSDNPQVKVIGAKRLAGFGTVLAAPAAMQATFRAKTGTTAEEQEALRSFVPEWNQYSDLMIVEKKGPGRYSLIDGSYINPHQIFRDGFNALVANGLEWDERVEAVFDELASPFGDEGILTATIADVLRNRTKDGRTVYPANGTREEKIAAVLRHVGAKLEPGVISQGRDVVAAVTGKENPKTGRTVDPQKLLYSFLTGTRQLEIDVGKKLVFQAQDLQRARTEASSMWLRAKKRERIRPEELLAAKTRANEAWGRALDDMRDRIAAARATGLSDYQIRRILDKESQVSQETINALLRGGYPKIAK